MKQTGKTKLAIYTPERKRKSGGSDGIKGYVNSVNEPNVRKKAKRIKCRVLFRGERENRHWIFYSERTGKLLLTYWPEKKTFVGCGESGASVPRGVMWEHLMRFIVSKD